MNKKVGLIFFATAFLYANQYALTIQLYTSDTLKPAIRYYNSLPKKIKKKSFILKIGKYYTIRYLPSKNAKKEFEQIKSEIKDAFEIDTYEYRLKNPVYPKKNFKKSISKKPVINLPLAIYKADKFFKEGLFYESLKEYEKIYPYLKEENIAINLSYLYGLLDKPEEFEKFLKNDEFKEMSLYSFSVGMIKRGDLKNLKNIILKNLKYSKRGYLDVIAGYLFEKEKNYEKALSYYKNAYFKNYYNPYFIYAYARGLDLNRKYKEALNFYKKIVKNCGIISKYAKERIFELRFTTK
jgi:tetratricopeptide (TPR) repeat protein